MGYRAKVGGYKWNTSLAETIRRDREILAGLEKLKRVAQTTDTELFIYDLMVKVLENIDSLHQLQQMDDRELVEQFHGTEGNPEDSDDVSV